MNFSSTALLGKRGPSGTASKVRTALRSYVIVEQYMYNIDLNILWIIIIISIDDDNRNQIYDKML